MKRDLLLPSFTFFSDASFASNSLPLTHHHLNDRYDNDCYYTATKETTLHCPSQPVSHHQPQQTQPQMATKTSNNLPLLPKNHTLPISEPITTKNNHHTTTESTHSSSVETVTMVSSNQVYMPSAHTTLTLECIFQADYFDLFLFPVTWYKSVHGNRCQVMAAVTLTEL